MLGVSLHVIPRVSHFQMLQSRILATHHFFGRAIIRRTFCAVPLKNAIPGGEAPPTVQPMTFRIRRTSRNNLPVYLDYRNRKARVFTLVKRIEGNIHDFHKEILEYCNDPAMLSFVDELKGEIQFNGNYKREIIHVIRENGY